MSWELVAYAVGIALAGFLGGMAARERVVSLLERLLAGLKGEQ